jgi:hypothetical protein
MMVKLDRLPMKPEEGKIPDISLLSPEDQDRVFELFRKNRDSLAGIKPTISRRELNELEGLLADLPMIGLDDKRAGPKIAVPHALESYWRRNQPASSPGSYRFNDLRALQKVRFVELCRNYGWREGTPPSATLLPLGEWEERDRDEMNTLLEAADHPGPLLG